nr:reverse transcriptase domain-containing protein [Tanacetum cinerariifolium]
MDSNFNNENVPWEFSLDIDDSDLCLIPQTKLLTEKVFILDSEGALMSTQEYMQKVVKDVGEDEDFNCGAWVNETNYVIAHGGTIPGTIHYKVIGKGGNGKDITVGAAMILVNVFVFTPKPSKHYLNITKKNVVMFSDEEENPFGGRRQNLRGMNRDDPLRNLGMKIEIPKFMGKARPDDFIDWLSTVERIFDLRDILEKLKVKLVAIKLRKSASLWWEHVKNQRAGDGKSKVETWDKMKKLLRAKFLPINHRQEAFLEYHNFSQRTSSFIEDFIAEFDQLRMRCAVVEEEEHVIARYMGLGHLARECPNKQIVTILDDVPPVHDTEYDDEVVTETAELVYADQGEALVTQRVLNVDMMKTSDDSSWLRNNIFRTKCTKKGKFVP